MCGGSGVPGAGWVGEFGRLGSSTGRAGDDGTLWGPIGRDG